jgi:hypothetical protein
MKLEQILNGKHANRLFSKRYALGIKVHLAPGRGHMLGADYVGSLLDRWLIY